MNRRKFLSLGVGAAAALLPAAGEPHRLNTSLRFERVGEK